MSSPETSNYDNINLAKEKVDGVAEKIDIVDITELLKTSGGTELLKSSFEDDFESKQSLADISDTITNSLDLNNLNLTRGSADVYALQIIGHIDDKNITIDGIVGDQTKGVIEKLKGEVGIDINKAQQSIVKNNETIESNKTEILVINTQIKALDTQDGEVDNKIQDLNVKIGTNKASIDTFNKANPSLATDVANNKTSLQNENDKLVKLNKTENIGKVMQDIFEGGELNGDDLGNINKLIAAKDTLEKDFPKTHERLLGISNMLFDSILEKGYMVSNENDSKAIVSLSQLTGKDINLPAYSDVIKHTYANTPFSIAQEDGKLKVYSTDGMLSSRLGFIENGKFVEDKSFFDQDNKYDNSEIDKNWAGGAAILFDMRDEIIEKKSEINKNISDLKIEKIKLDSSSKELKKLTDTKIGLEDELTTLNTEKTDINNKKTPLVEKRNQLTSTNSGLDKANKSLENDIKAQELKDSQLLTEASNDSTTNSGDISSITTNSNGSTEFNSDSMPTSVSYERSTPDGKHTETYDISYAPETNDKGYIDAQIDDWGENTHIMSKDEGTLKGFINHYQNFREGEEKDIFSEGSDLFNSNNKLELGIDGAWDIKVVEIGSVSCITVQGGLGKDDFVIPLSYDKSNTDNLTLLNTIQDATGLDLSYTMEDNDKGVEGTLNGNTRSYESGINVTKTDTFEGKFSYDSNSGVGIGVSSGSSYEATGTNKDWAEEFHLSDLFEGIPVCDQEIKTIDGKNYLFFEFDDSYFNESFNKRVVNISEYGNVNEADLKNIIKGEVGKSQSEAKFLSSDSNKGKLGGVSIVGLDSVTVDKFSIEANDDKLGERIMTVELNSGSWSVSDYNIELKYDSTMTSMADILTENKTFIENEISKENLKRIKEAKEREDARYNNDNY